MAVYNSDTGQAWILAGTKEDSMGFFQIDGGALVWQEGQQKVWIQPWGVDGLRLRANLAGQPLNLPQALLPAVPVTGEIALADGGRSASLRNGKIRMEISAAGRISYLQSKTGAVLLEEPDLPYFAPPNRHFKPGDGRLHRIEAWFKAQEGERFYGLGQHPHGRLDNTGCVIELQQRNTEVSIPFMISSRRYGFLWNNPGVGRVELGNNATRWVSDGSQQLDYYVVYGETPTGILERYSEVTGRTPPLPDWASGFWQCKLRYETQEELLSVARDYKRRGLPLSVIVIDFFAWSHMGDWRFDAQRWPDPAGMVRELDSLGVKVMVSIWPTVSPISENYAEMKARGLLVNNERGTDALHVFVDHDINGPAYFTYYDATHPEGRRYIWEKVRQGYYNHGLRMWWLDNDEPDANPWDPTNLRFYLGSGVEVANLYPLLHQQAFYEGMQSAGESEIITLSRSGWAGSQRFGSAIWSGDIASTFEALQAQVRAGLNMAMSGIPWWTTDIGGFHGGDIRTDYFKELIVRWFQYGVFCPIFRLHGHRQPERSPFPGSGADNEVWSFGEEAYTAITRLLFLRERLRPYIHKHMLAASQTGLPVMRPLFVDFPADPTCLDIEDQFMFGPDLLVAPVLHQGVNRRRVYLPAGAEWQEAWSGVAIQGGDWVDAPAPLDTIPVYLRVGSLLQPIFRY
jgi:alpha-D-xyloside xylohydrolase